MRAAERFGYTHEGVLRQNAWIKNRNWDTAVYAILDGEWAERAARLASELAGYGAVVDHRTLPSGHELSQADVMLAQQWVEQQARS